MYLAGAWASLCNKHSSHCNNKALGKMSKIEGSDAGPDPTSRWCFSFWLFKLLTHCCSRSFIFTMLRRSHKHFKNDKVSVLFNSLATFYFIFSLQNTHTELKLTRADVDMWRSTHKFVKLARMVKEISFDCAVMCVMSTRWHVWNT